MLTKILDNFTKLPNNIKIFFLILIDTFILISSLYISISARLGYFFSSFDIKYIFVTIISPLICLPIFYRAGLYSNVIRYINFNFVIKIFIAILIYSTIWGLISLLIRPESFPRSVILINLFVTLTLITNFRVIAKLFIDYNQFYQKTKKTNVLIYGANVQAISLYETIKNYKSINVISFIDNSPEFKNRYIYNLKVIPTEKIAKKINNENIDEIYIAKNINSKIERDLITNICDKNNILIKTRTEDLLTSQKYNNNDLNLFEKIEPSDFLKRDIVESYNSLITKNISSKIVLITGAGGSIGSEIAFQSLSLAPSKLILYEQNEYALFKIYNKLKTLNKNNIEILCVLGSISSKFLVHKILKKEKPHIIFHTAAYKHVSFVQQNIQESFINNVFGTSILVDECIKNNINHFVNISTDKAVNPSNFMGATKRLSEMLIQSISKKADNTKFSIVRFGNVIGSSGSVVPIFKKQIKEKGPVTVSHPEVKRYFMSISEAAQLVMQSSSLGKNGDIFILEMGRPVSIYELAKQMIAEDAQKNHYDKNEIKIIFTGLPKYEKINEDLYYNSKRKESLHPKIYIDSEKFDFQNQFLKDFDNLVKDISLINENRIMEFTYKYTASLKIEK